MSSGVDIKISDSAVKWIIGGVCFLGVCYLFLKLIENQSDDQIKLPKEAKDFSALPELSPSKFENLGFNKEVREKAFPAFQAKDFSGSVRAAAIALYDIIRRKSGEAQTDATHLVQRVFKGDNPILKFVNIAPAHVSNVEAGIIDMLEGFSKSIRKLHMHANVELTENKALQEISIACYLSEVVENNTVRVGGC